LSIPNAGLPFNDGGRTLYPMKSRPMAETLREFVTEAGRQQHRRLLRHHARHIRAMVAASGGARPRTRGPGRSGWYPV
jgi:methionine synthase I (cobalamin-dependent)